MENQTALPNSWEGWTITELIGKGSYGSVYKARFLSADPNAPEQLAAIKIISIPANDESLADSLQQEIRTMESLRNNPNAVVLQDHHIAYDREHGTTVYLRMEFLTPLTEYKITHELSAQDVIRLGIDLCNILQECAEKNIIHRDIKPENILVDEEGHFKLGDFGIARKMAMSAGELSVKGTFVYMAPEVYHGEPYDVRADQYSLGLVMYRLLNNNRDPFIDPQTPMVSYEEREEALHKRMAGEILPYPANGGETLGRIIRKACAYRPENRFESISDMSEALQRCLRGEDFALSNLVEISEAERLELLRRKRRKKRIIIGSLTALCLALIIGCAVYTRTAKTEYEVMLEASEKTEEHIRETGIKKDNAFQETDLSSAESCARAANQSKDASDLRGRLEEDVLSYMESADEQYGNCESTLIYADETNALGLAVYYNTFTDNVTNTQQVLPNYKYYYYSKENGSWNSYPELMIPDSVKTAIYEDYLPAGFMEARRSGRNWCLYPKSFWIGEGAVFRSAIKMETAALWQNEDGSADVYILCRNGTDRLGAEYNYWILLQNDREEEVISCWGRFDADRVTVEPGSVKGYLLHLEPEEVLTGTGKWPDTGLWSFISGNNSNYE